MAENNKNIILVSGYPGSGKSRKALEILNEIRPYGGVHLNTRIIGGSENDLINLIENKIVMGTSKFVIDNEYPNPESRANIIKLAKKYNFHIKIIRLTTSLENSQRNCVERMLKITDGKLLTPREIKKDTRYGITSTVDIYKYRRYYSKPTEDEGFDEIESLKFKRDNSISHNKAIIFDLYSIIRTKSGRTNPVDKNDFDILPGRQAALSDFKAKGYEILAVSNISAVGKGIITELDAIAIYNRINHLLDNIITDYKFCTHSTFPIQCFCKKPLPGIGAYFAYKYKLNNKNSLVITHETSDTTFAKRCGFGSIESLYVFDEYEKFELEMQK